MKIALIATRDPAACATNHGSGLADPVSGQPHVELREGGGAGRRRIGGHTRSSSRLEQPAELFIDQNPLKPISERVDVQRIDQDRRIAAHLGQ